MGKVLLKEIIFNPEYIGNLAKAISEQTGSKAKQVEKAILNSDWKKLELLDRVHHIADALKQFLPKDYGKAIALLTQARKQMPILKHSNFADILFSDFVARNGLNDFKLSINALENFTVESSSEFAVRPFIVEYPKRMMGQMLSWTQSKNLHIRRLASEGCRPRLPWGIALADFKIDPAPIMPILEALKDDKEEYIRRSVANNLNDIAKDHPNLVVKIAKKWYGKSENRNRLVKHALRTLLKQGNTEALAIFGYGNAHDINITSLKTSKKSYKIGEHLSFELSIAAKSKKVFRLEYVIHYMKANGKTNAKVFQLAERTFDTNEIIKRKHSLKQMTTRKHHPGLHKLAIHVNGIEVNIIEFNLQS